LYGIRIAAFLASHSGLVNSALAYPRFYALGCILSPGSRLAAAGSSAAPLGTLMTSIEAMPLKSGKRGVSGIGGLFCG